MEILNDLRQILTLESLLLTPEEYEISKGILGTVKVIPLTDEKIDPDYLIKPPDSEEDSDDYWLKQGSILPGIAYNSSVGNSTSFQIERGNKKNDYYYFLETNRYLPLPMLYDYISARINYILPNFSLIEVE